MDYLKHILFVDIETVPLMPDYHSLTERLQMEWDKKSRYLKSNQVENADPSMLFSERAGIFSEFARVVCIVVGSLQQNGEVWKLRLKSVANEEEATLLRDFVELLGKVLQFYPNTVFCGHNIKEFDIPFLCRRMIINGIALPEMMQLNGKKPWEVNHIDTMDMWRFGDYKHFTSLSLLAEVLGIPSPKDDMDGSMVADVFWKEKDLPRIARYCMQDVLTTAKVYLHLKGLPHIHPEPVYVTE